ncbi:MAG: hypothetical protein ABIF82_00175 [Planctomycetota bacterium]
MRQDNEHQLAGAGVGGRASPTEGRRRERIVAACGLAALLGLQALGAMLGMPSRAGYTTLVAGPRSGKAPAAWQTWGTEFLTGDRATPADVARMKAFARGRTGFVVWESRRPSGTRQLKYRIWKRNLDGSRLAMVSGAPFTDGYAHLGPRISPDGRFVIFAGRSWSSDRGDPDADVLYAGAYVAPPFDAWVVEIDPVSLDAGAPRELAAVRGLLGSAGQDRFFEWKDSRTVYVNIPSQRGIFELDVVSGVIGAKVVRDVDACTLLSPGGTSLFRASPGGVVIQRLDRAGPVATPGPGMELPGCQAVVTAGDEFALWMRTSGKVAVLDLAGADGHERGGILPLRRMIRDAHEPYHHCYFPNLSRDRRMLVLGASRFPPSVCGAMSNKNWLRHSHRGADYEIFLAEFDPETLLPVGPTARYSFNDHSMYPELLTAGADDDLQQGHVLDRFPDVWVRGAASENGDRHPVGCPRVPPLHLAEVLPADEGQHADGMMATARRLETVEPKAALDLYDRIAAERGGRERARLALERANLLRGDSAFRRELAAWEVIERMRRAEAAVTVPEGAARSFRGNPELAKQNVRALRALRAGYCELRASYRDTRAMLEARDMIRRWDIGVPRETPAGRRVVAVVEAAAVHISTPMTLNEIFPYTQAFMTAEFRVRRVISGRAPQQRFIAVLMSMDGGKDLPAASLKPGGVMRLRLGLWADQEHFHSHKMADDILDLDATYYFVFPAG